MHRRDRDFGYVVSPAVVVCEASDAANMQTSAAESQRDYR